MKDQKINKSNIFKTAWELLKSGKSINLSEALKSAWRMSKTAVKTVINKLSIKNQIAGSRIERGSMFDFCGDFSKLMEIADSKGHFVGSIIQNAIDGKFVSEKQAWAVAYFADQNL